MSCGRDSAETSDFRLAPLNILDGWEIFGSPIFHSLRSMVVLRQCRTRAMAVRIPRSLKKPGRPRRKEPMITHNDEGKDVPRREEERHPGAGGAVGGVELQCCAAEKKRAAEFPL